MNPVLEHLNVSFNVSFSFNVKSKFSVRLQYLHIYTQIRTSANTTEIHTPHTKDWEKSMQ